MRVLSSTTPMLCSIVIYSSLSLILSISEASPNTKIWKKLLSNNRDFVFEKRTEVNQQRKLIQPTPPQFQKTLETFRKLSKDDDDDDDDEDSKKKDDNEKNNDDADDTSSSGNKIVEDTCDAAFIKCLTEETCIQCFQDLDDFGVNWAGVSLNTPCTDVIDLLNDNDHCKALQDNGKQQDIFCTTFNACAVWSDDDDVQWGSAGSLDDVATRGEDDEIGDVFDDFFPDLDCSSLKKCEWEGMHQYFVGDGLCHDFACYNTEVCDWDGGDCCPDTCDNTSPYFECGQDHYWCRDPNSENCNMDLGVDCPNAPDPDKKRVPKCDNGKIYLLRQYDTFGDGWDKTSMSITREDNGKEIYKGGLSTGFEGYEYLCLESTCYNVKVTGGIWGNEVSWEVVMVNQETVTIADGGTPMDCTFPVAGNFCDNTCAGGSNIEFDKDDSWHGYSSLESCLEKTCMIQFNGCKKDESCQHCLSDDDTPSYCYTSDSYNALVDCAFCNCVDDKPDYCFDKNGDNVIDQSDANDSYSSCTPQQTLSGADSIFAFSQCSKIDSVEAMINDWDENHFGTLDEFEMCSHTYTDAMSHGGKKAMDCMRILESIVNNKSRKEQQAVVNIATDLYNKGQDFCDCTNEVHKTTPPCKDFIHFKVLLWESLDACVALDEIDCAAWDEFYAPCKKKMLEKFDKVNFYDKKQCTYIEEGCDGEGPFPAFRRLDCGKEISKSGWDFYLNYQRGCQASAPAPTPKSPTSPTPPAPTPKSPTSPTPKTPTAPSPTPKIPTAPVKPYIPEDDDVSEPYRTAESTHSSRRPFAWIFALSCVGVVGYVVYKRRMNRNTFDYIRYQRQRNYAGFENSDLQSGLTDMSSSWSFEPPSLPPTPSQA